MSQSRVAGIFGVLLCMFGFVLLGEQEEPSVIPTPPAESAAVATVEAEPASPYASAMFRAKRDGRLLLVLATAEWCEPCKRVDRSALSALGEFCEVDADGDVAELFRAYPLPSLFVWTDPDKPGQRYTGTDRIEAFCKRESNACRPLGDTTPSRFNRPGRQFSGQPTSGL